VNKNKVWLQRTNLPQVNAITVNQIITNKALLQKIATKYKPTIESMEGAALHYVCIQHNVPFVQIRGISNYVGERNKSKWKIKEAIRNSNQVLIYLFESL
jgi:futalosine hydrolase